MQHNYYIYMKNTSELYVLIWKMWSIEKLNYAQIAERPLPSFLALNRIRNIIYSGPARLNTEHQKEIYKVFRLKFLELQDVDSAIKYVADNQPERKLCESRIRYIISYMLKTKNHDYCNRF